MKVSEQQQSKLLFSKSKNTYGQLVHKVLNLVHETWLCTSNYCSL